MKRQNSPLITWYYPILGGSILFLFAYFVKKDIGIAISTGIGDITGMDEVYQFSELSMGWCVNCHRQTKVNFNKDANTGNKFYSIYEKFHDDIKSGKMDSVTVKDIGGLECQKCHY